VIPSVHNPNSGGGGGISGSPNAIVYIDPPGTGATTDPKLTAFPIDQFGRPQILDRRFMGAPGTGAVLRQGGWQVDGDPVNVQGEGIVVYGAAPNGLMDGSNGTIGRMKYDRFQIRLIQLGFDVGSAWRVDCTREFFTDDTGTVSAEIVRNTGVATFRRMRARNASASETANQMAGKAATGLAGSVVVANTSVTGLTRIQLSIQDGGAVPTSAVYVSARVPGVSFTITSIALDVGVSVYWQLWEPF